jgi:DNA-binding LacI/PurR family transcriptional regulator
MLARIEEVTAIFAANDQTALGILRALHEHGRTVPRDVSIVGFDDLPESGDFIPPLTTMRQDFDSVGRKALAMLVAQMDGSSSALRELIAPTLVARDSVAAPPATTAQEF